MDGSSRISWGEKEIYWYNGWSFWVDYPRGVVSGRKKGQQKKLVLCIFRYKKAHSKIFPLCYEVSDFAWNFPAQIIKKTQIKWLNIMGTPYFQDIWSSASINNSGFNFALISFYWFIFLPNYVLLLFLLTTSRCHLNYITCILRFNRVSSTTCLNSFNLLLFQVSSPMSSSPRHLMCLSVF